MLIVCPACVSSYRIDSAVLDATRNTVRCAHCRRTWVVAPSASGTPAGRHAEGLWQFETVADDAFSAAEAPALGSPMVLGVRSVPPARRKGETAPKEGERSAFRVLTVVALVIGLGMGALACRTVIARAVPASETVFAAIGLPTTPSGLQLGNVQSEIGRDGASKVLTVEGEIRNGRAEAVALSALRIVVRDGAEQKLYSWTEPPPKASLAPGEAVPFQSRLVGPPDAGRDLLVSFAETPGGGEAVPVKERP